MLAIINPPKKEIAYMRENNKSKEELLKELTNLRHENDQLKKSEKKLKQAQKALRESEEMYRKLVKTSPDAIAIHDLNDTIIEVSQRWIEMWGFDNAKEIIGRSGFEFIAPESQEEAKSQLHELLQEGFIKSLQMRCLKKDGARFIGEIYGALIKDASGKAKAIMTIARDITERKREQKELWESREMYRLLLKTSPDAVAVSDLDGKTLEVSHRTLELMGYETIDEFIKKNAFDNTAPEEHETITKALQENLKKGYVRNLEVTFVRKNGTRFIGEVYTSLVRDVNGNPKAIIGTIRDITERKKMEEKLRHYSRLLEKRVEERTRKLEESQQEIKSLRKQIQQSIRYPEIIGSSAAILQVIDLTHQVAQTNYNVLIIGETGSGKDLIARAIHFNSSRKEAPFLAINCAALPEQLIESELFGYAKGAFTGASQDKKWLFEEANKGTIFLDEIADIPLRLQGKLLQVIENQIVRRLGQSKSIKVDVRIVAASNIDLEEAANTRNFRQDLFYRLNVFPIRVPPLRERKEDIPLLVKHFLDKYCLSMDKKITDISQKTMDLLCEYNYPGNVRELENIIQRAIIMAQGPILLPRYLPDKLIGVAASGIRANLANVEKNMIINVIHQCKGDLDQAAKQLGYSRTTLWRRMKKLDINL
jgi:two-component system response regulator HydG